MSKYRTYLHLYEFFIKMLHLKYCSLLGLGYHCTKIQMNSIILKYKSYGHKKVKRKFFLFKNFLKEGCFWQFLYVSLALPPHALKYYIFNPDYALIQWVSTNRKFKYSGTKIHINIFYEYLEFLYFSYRARMTKHPIKRSLV